MKRVAKCSIEKINKKTSVLGSWCASAILFVAHILASKAQERIDVFHIIGSLFKVLDPNH